MDKQTQKTFQAFDQTVSDANDEIDNMTNLQDDTVNKSENVSDGDKLSDDENISKNEELKAEETSNLQMQDAVVMPDWEEKYAALNDAHIRLVAEFDNYRKRTIREKAELIKSGSATALTNLLPVIDDLERALSTLQATDDISSAVNGVKIIYDKFISYLSKQGVKVIETEGQPFDTDLFEAIATFPTPDETRKGMVIDCLQTGYKLFDKVLRHAKVVVGE